LNILLPRGSIGLLLDVVLRATLLRLANVMLLLVLGLLAAVARHASDSVAEGAGGAVRQARREIAELSASLLLLALEVLLTAGLLKVLGADKAADGLLS
jgi:hypothetical protein